jgi:hypothetical protein
MDDGYDMDSPAPDDKVYTTRKEAIFYGLNLNMIVDTTHWLLT